MWNMLSNASGNITLYTGVQKTRYSPAACKIKESKNQTEQLQRMRKELCDVKTRTNFRVLRFVVLKRSNDDNCR